MNYKYSVFRTNVRARRTARICHSSRCNLDDCNWMKGCKYCTAVPRTECTTESVVCSIDYSTTLYWSTSCAHRSSTLYSEYSSTTVRSIDFTVKNWDWGLLVRSTEDRHQMTALETRDSHMLRTSTTYAWYSVMVF